MNTTSSRRPHRARKITLMTVGSVVGAVVLCAGLVLTVGGIFVPATYLEPWSTSYSSHFADPRMKVVSQALLAPSGHNMQPWTITLDQTDADVLYLYADPTRLTPAVDPLARQTMVSQGAFLEYLTVSAQNLGFRASIDLFPRGGYDEQNLSASMSAMPVAKITLARDSTASTSDYASLFRSDTNRSPYTDVAVTPAQVTDLSSLGAGADATVKIFTGQSDLDTLGALAVEGTLIETTSAAATDESDAVFHSNETAKNLARSGFAVEGQGTSGFMKYIIQGLITLVPAINDDAASAKSAIAMTGAGVAHTPAYALISTPTNTREAQVHAGILYAEFSLRARTLGLVVQPLSQVLQEYPAMAAPYSAIHQQYAAEGQTLQMLVRLGSPTSEYPTSMRRDASDLVQAP